MANQKRSLMASILSHFSYFQKFVIICLLFGASILVSGFFMIKAQNKSIRIAEQELRGNEFIRIARKLMEAVSEHKLLSYRLLTGKAEVKNDLINLETDVNADFKNLIAINRDLQKTFSITSDNFQGKEMIGLRPAEIEKKWEDLARKLNELTPETSNSFHDQIISDIKNLIFYIAETSNLVVDPYVESTYIMNTIIYELPRSQFLIPKIVILGEELIEKKDPLLSDKLTLVGLLAVLKDNVLQTKMTIDRQYANAKVLQSDLDIEARLKEPVHEYFDAIQEFITYTDAKIIHTSEEPAKRSEFIALGAKALTSNFALWDAAMDQFDRIIKLRLAKFKLQQRLSIAASLLCALIGIFLGYIVMREISRPLMNMVAAAKRLTEGDLSTRVEISFSDEVGRVGTAFNQMAEAFQELLGQLQWTGIQLTTSTTEIAAAAKQQEASVVEQEATTKQIAVTAREISTTAKEFAKTMNDVSSTAEQTSALASSGKAGLSRMETIMRQMVDASQNIASKLAVLNEKAGNITSVITTISKVADQTNLLSLNAAIEAEKAGEHGRTFSVIAREIRRLADQTANATLDIEKMVNEMVSAVSAGVMGVDKFSEEIHTGVSQVGIVSEQLSKIIEQVQQQTSSFENVNQGMQAQSLGAEQINDSINQLSETAQQATESIRQFHNAIEQLNNAAQDMQTAVSKLKR